MSASNSMTFLTNSSRNKNLHDFVHNDWIYFEIRRGVYDLPQSIILTNKLLEKRLNTAGYYHAATTLGIWCHK